MSCEITALFFSVEMLTLHVEQWKGDKDQETRNGAELTRSTNGN